MSGAEAPVYDAVLAAMLQGRAVAQAESLRGVDLSRVILAIQLDHPETFYWDASKVRYTLIGSGAVVNYRVELAYLYPLAEIAARQKRIAAKVTALLSGAERLPPFERMVYLHDTLALSISYSGEENKPYQCYTIEGPLAEGLGVCSGISRAYKYLMNLAGLSCMVVHGTVRSKDGRTESHAWNLVQVDGHCHHVDVTWNDNNDNYLSHAYLAVSDAEISYDHRTSGDWPLPPCSTSRCPLPVVRSIPELAEAIVIEHAQRQSVTETRVLGMPYEGAELMQLLRKHCWIGQKGRACNAIKAWSYIPATHIFVLYWK